MVLSFSLAQIYSGLAAQLILADGAGGGKLPGDPLQVDSCKRLSTMKLKDAGSRNALV